MVGLLILVIVSVRSYEITRPMNGLHSWGEAHRSWFARSHVEYGLGYTKGYMTWAVGDPPPATPKRYLNHPQLYVLLNAGFMAVLGVNDWSLRVFEILLCVASLVILVKLFRDMLDARTALLAGALLAMFPLTSYFGLGLHEIPPGLLAIWFYLAILGELKGVTRKRWHLWVLGAMLFLTIQMAWEGFFFPFGIGLHYVARCIWRRQWPEWKLLAVLVVAPLLSTAMVFVHLIIGRGGDYQKIIDVYRWRTTAQATLAHGEGFQWGRWFARLGDLAVMDFTWPILLLAGGQSIYCGAAWIIGRVRAKTRSKGLVIDHPIRHFWLLFLIPLTQFVILKGAVWHHHYWLQPVAPLIALAAASALLVLWKLLRKTNVTLAGIIVGGIFLVCVFQSVKGAKYYYDIIQHPLPKIEMLKRIRAGTPPDKALLSFESFVVEEHPAKGSHYRPQIAWYLDREIVEARSFAEVQAQARTGRFRYYLIPAVRQLGPLLRQLVQKYEIADQVKAVQPVPGLPIDPDMPMNRGMLPYVVLDLTRPRK